MPSRDTTGDYRREKSRRPESGRAESQDLLRERKPQRASSFLQEREAATRPLYACRRLCVVNFAAMRSEAPFHLEDEWRAS
jgi:hypothetical protein